MANEFSYSLDKPLNPMGLNIIIKVISDYNCQNFVFKAKCKLRIYVSLLLKLCWQNYQIFY